MFTKFNFIKSIISTNTLEASLRRMIYGNRYLVSQSQGQGSALASDLIRTALQKNFPKAADIIVQDISGGCGAMFEVYVVSDEFKGMPKVKQHLAVSSALKKEIQDMHGIRIFTDLPGAEKQNNK